MILKRSLFVFPLFCSLIMAAGAPAFATGNVLLPSTNNGVTAPNLGLVPVAPPASGQADASTDPQPTPTTTIAPTIITPEPLSTVSTPLPYTPAPQDSDIVSKLATISPRGPIVYQAPIPTTSGPAQFTAADVFPPNMPRDKMDMNMLASTQAEINSAYPNEMIVNLVRPTWGASDISTISKQLGISASKVSSTCSLSLSGPILTSQGAYTVDTAGGPADLRYNGQISSVSLLRIQALCPLVQLPPDAGSATQVGNKYMLTIGLVKCPAPMGLPRGMTVTYKGNGATQCAYN